MYYPGCDINPEEEQFYKILEQELRRAGIKHNGEAVEEKEMSEDVTQNSNALTVGEKPTNLVVMDPNKKAVHMKLKIKGSAEKILFFHWLMAELDPDWPYAATRRNPHLKVYCQDCKGYIYRDNEYSPEEIKLIAKQIDNSKRPSGSLNVRVKMFTRLTNCADVATVAEAQVDPEDTAGDLGVN